MHQLTCNISIGGFQFNYVTDVTIDSSWKKLTDTAVITLPRNLTWEGDNLRELIKRGDPVQINLGYDFQERQEFVGYVSGLKATTPTQIECEDSMWLLKQTNHTESWQSTTLQEVLQSIVPETIQFEALDVELGPFRFSKVSTVKVLQELKKKYGLVSFFRDRTLVVGFPYPDVPENVELHFQGNVVRNDLTYRRDDDIQIRVSAISIQPDGSKIEEVVGDPDGERHTLHFYNLPKAELIRQATEEMKKLRIEGYRGRITSFGIPFIAHGDTATLYDTDYPERQGTNFVDEVKVMFGQNGFRRISKIGAIAS